MKKQKENAEVPRVRQGDTNRHKRRIANLIHEPKLNWDQINEIRRKYVFRSSTHGTTAFASQHNVSVNTIHKIVRGKIWKIREGDGNVSPPLQEKVTARAFAQALGDLGENQMKLRAWARKIAP